MQLDEAVFVRFSPHLFWCGFRNGKNEIPDIYVSRLDLDVLNW